MHTSKHLINSYQIQCFTFEAPIKASLFPILTNQRTKPLEKYSTNLNQSENSNDIHKQQQAKQIKQKYSLVIWDKNNQVLNYVCQNYVNETHSQTYSIDKIGDTKVNKCAIKKAFTIGQYFIILDQDNIVTIRKQWEIYQCFSDIVDLAIHPQIQQNGKVYSILVMSQIQIPSCINLEDQVSQNYQSELVFVIIEQDLSRVQNQHISSKITKQFKKLPKKLVKSFMNQSIYLKLGKNGTWAHVLDKVINIKITIDKGDQKLNQDQIRFPQNCIRIDVTYFQLQTIGISNYLDLKIISMKELQNTHESNHIVQIIFLNQQKLSSLRLQLQRQKINKILQRVQGVCIQLKQSNKKYINITSMTQIKDIELEIVYLSKQQKQFYLQKSENLNSLLILLSNHSIIVYETQKCTKIKQIDLKQLINQQISNSCKIVYSENNNIFIFDSQFICLHKVNIEEIVNKLIIKELSNIQQQESNQQVSGHNNIMKVLALRGKVLKVLNNYIHQKNIPDYNSSLRLLNNQENISILHDGILYILQNIFKSKNKEAFLLTSGDINLVQFEDNIIKLLSKLVMSKYQNHIQNGLKYLSLTYTFFQNKQNKQSYQKIAQSKRVTKLLNQEKKRTLFQLAYTFNIKIIGNQGIK